MDEVKIIKEVKYVCERCGSDDIMLKYWYNPNTNEAHGWDESGECYCNHCKGLSRCTPIYKKIMDGTTAHNKEYVRRINLAWNNEKQQGALLAIIFAMGLKYADECEEVIEGYDRDIFDMGVAYELAPDILSKVCDDSDLELILKFID